jgi:hypothetical protein
VNIDIKRATRQGVRPLIGLYSESACGKTLSRIESLQVILSAEEAGALEDGD